MIILPREVSERRLETRAGPAASENPAASGDETANRLNPDEWEFLRATPDFDAEEMSSVTLAEPGYRPPCGWDGGPNARTHRSEPCNAASDDFPEVGTLAEMLGDLIEKPGGPGTGAADATWSNVPAAAEWASLMEPHGSVERPAAPTRGTVPAPATRDVLLDALAAGERIGLLPGEGQR
jgi:hypothetical protein